MFRDHRTDIRAGRVGGSIAVMSSSSRFDNCTGGEESWVTYENTLRGQVTGIDATENLHSRTESTDEEYARVLQNQIDAEDAGFVSDSNCHGQQNRQQEQQQGQSQGQQRLLEQQHRQQFLIEQQQRQQFLIEQQQQTLREQQQQLQQQQEMLELQRLELLEQQQQQLLDHEEQMLGQHQERQLPELREHEQLHDGDGDDDFLEKQLQAITLAPTEEKKQQEARDEELARRMHLGMWDGNESYMERHPSIDGRNQTFFETSGLHLLDSEGAGTLGNSSIVELIPPELRRGSTDSLPLPDITGDGAVNRRALLASSRMASDPMLSSTRLDGNEEDSTPLPQLLPSRPRGGASPRRGDPALRGWRNDLGTQNATTGERTATFGGELGAGHRGESPRNFPLGPPSRQLAPTCPSRAGEIARGTSSADHQTGQAYCSGLSDGNRVSAESPAFPITGDRSATSRQQLSGASAGGTDISGSRSGEQLMNNFNERRGNGHCDPTPIAEGVSSASTSSSVSHEESSNAVIPKPKKGKMFRKLAVGRSSPSGSVGVSGTGDKSSRSWDNLRKSTRRALNMGDSSSEGGTGRSTPHRRASTGSGFYECPDASPNSTGARQTSEQSLPQRGAGQPTTLRSRQSSANRGIDGASHIALGISRGSLGGSFRATVTGASATATAVSSLESDASERQANQSQSQSQSSKKKKKSRGKGGGRSTPAICDACQETATSYLVALGKKYHRRCFLCMGCHEVIDPSSPFTYTEVEDTGEKHPLHRSCYAELFGMKCTICKQSIPTADNGRISYMKHPFFDEEIMCPDHNNSTRRCAGCHRFEPQFGTGFAELSDGDRCVCLSCCRSVILDNADAKPLWEKVLKFFEHNLGLPVWQEMKEIPILIVGSETLNENEASADSAHSGSAQIMTRGLCLSEHCRGRSIGLSPSMRFDSWSQSLKKLPSSSGENEVTYFTIPDASESSKKSHITAILCLSGLPADLAASILAHEATHAWIKLHPQYQFDNPIPPQVEEGCCQLVAHLFLQDGLDQAAREVDDGGPTDEKLRQYFKFSIETDANEIYGEGFRKASRAFSEIGIELLLSHVVLYRAFPDL